MESYGWTISIPEYVEEKDFDGKFSDCEKENRYSDDGW